MTEAEGNAPFPPKDFACRVCQKTRDEVINKGLIIKVCDKHLGDEIYCALCNKQKASISLEWKTGTNLKCNKCKKKNFTYLVMSRCYKCFDKTFCCHLVNFKKNDCPRCNQEWIWKDHTICVACDEKEHPKRESRNKSEINPPRDYLRQISIWGGIGSIALIAFVSILSLLKNKNKFGN